MTVLDGTWALINLVAPMGLAVLFLGSGYIVQADARYAERGGRGVSNLLTLSGVLAAAILACQAGVALSGRV